jgi:hypothetical protein
MEFHTHLNFGFITDLKSWPTRGPILRPGSAFG